MKVEFRNREILEAEGALAKLADIEMCQKAMYALEKNKKIIMNEVQDLRSVIQTDKDKYQSALLFEEKRQIILVDEDMSYDDRTRKIAELESQLPNSRNAIDDHKRETNETLKGTVELDLHEIKMEWLPEKLPMGALGPLVAVVTMEEDKEE